MMPSAPDSNAEFERPQYAFEREFGQFRNWWARDKRIVGNAFSLLLYLVSHDRGYRITQRKAQSDLGLGKDAFLVARRRLETAGYLTVTEQRFPAGTVNAAGKPIGGHRHVVYVLQDPLPPAEQASAENPLRPARTRPATKSPDPVQPLGGKAAAANPTQGIPPLKKINQTKDQSSSASTATPRTDDDQWNISEGTKTLLRELHPSLDALALVSTLTKTGLSDPKSLDLEAAASEILGRSSGPVLNPTAYVAKAICRDPQRWRSHPRSDHAQTRRLRPPTLTECSTSGHNWTGAWRECCASCGEERPGWRDDRDRTQATAGTP